MHKITIQWFIYCLVTCFIIIGLPYQSLADEGDPTRPLEALVRELQKQLGQYETQMTEQTKLIHAQGEAIATLKNQLEIVQQPSTVYLPSTTEADYKSHLADMLKEMQLGEKRHTPEDKELLTIYDDGFYLKGEDDTLKVGGWYQADLNVYEKGHEGDSRLRNRRARLDVRGVLEDVFEYRLYTQFAGAAANLQEAWLEYKQFPSARLRVGQFKIPFSLESSYSARWIDFVERSIGVTNLQPAEDLGAMLFGKFWDNRIEYAGGVFNGRARTLNDNNDAFDVAARVVVAPFLRSGNNLLKDLYVGGSLTSGSAEETLGGTSFTTAGGTAFFTYLAGVRESDNRSRFGGELQWIYGPGDIKAEYVGTSFNDVEAGTRKTDVNVNAWQVSGSYVLTGERKVRNKPIRPKHPFDLSRGGWGAWELAARYEQFIVNASPLLHTFATGTDQVDALTIGLNWWPNHHLRFMLDYVFTDFKDEITLGSGQLDNENVILSRLQYNF